MQKFDKGSKIANMGQDQEGSVGKHDQSKIKNDGWTEKQLGQDQAGNDAQIKKLEETLKEKEATKPKPPTS